LINIGVIRSSTKVIRMPKRTFSFLALPCVTLLGDIEILEKYLTPDAFLTYVQFMPYVAHKSNFRVFEQYIGQAFETVGQLPVENGTVREIYYAGLQKWYEEFHLPLRILQCFMSREPAAVVVKSLRVICEKINEGSVNLQQFMAGKRTDETNTARMMNEVTVLLGYFQREYPIAVFDLFGHLFETVSLIQKEDSHS
jgi:hypothetical protein